VPLHSNGRCADLLENIVLLLSRTLSNNDRCLPSHCLATSPYATIYVYMPVSSWEDNIKLELKDICCEDVDWIHIAHNGIQWRDIPSIYSKTCLKLTLY
jgi:hypothetical protein